MTKLLLLNTSIFLIIFLLTSCAANSTQTPSIQNTSPIEKSISAPQHREAWEEEWAMNLMNARKEGKIVLYSAMGGSPLAALRQAFDKKYGITLEAIAGRGPEIAEKLLSERRAGLNYPDVLLGASGPAVTTLSPGGHLDPIEPTFILPEVKDTSLWWTGKHIFLTSRRTTVALVVNPSAPFLINTNMVKPEELKSYDNLLEPKWKRNFIIGNPAIPGSMESIAQFLGWYVKNLDFLRDLVKQEPIINNEQRQQVEWVVRGKYPMAMGTQTSLVTEFINMGMPITYLTPREGSYLAAGTGVLSPVNKAPHPNAARIFINWIMSKEGLTLLTKETGEQSTREDIPVDFLPPFNVRELNKQYFPKFTEEWYLATTERREIVRQIFMPIMSR